MDGKQSRDAYPGPVIIDNPNSGVNDDRYWTGVSAEPLVLNEDFINKAWNNEIDSHILHNTHIILSPVYGENTCDSYFFKLLTITPRWMRDL